MAVKGPAGRHPSINKERNQMKQLVLRSLLAALVLAATASASIAGAWTAKKHAFYEKFAFNYYYSEDNFDKHGSRHGTPDNGEFDEYNISNYFEYGLFESLTLINSLTYKWLYNENDQLNAMGYGLGDVDLGARYKLLDSERIGIVSTQLLVKIPGTYDKSDALPLGNGQTDLEVRLLYGRSFYPLLPAYGNIELGYRWRFEDPSDEFRYLVEFGADITKALYARIKLDGTFSIDNGKKTDSSGNPTTTNNFDLGKLDIALGYRITPAWGVEASYRPDIYGQNTAAGANYSLALTWMTP
jgi:protein XagA